MHCPAFGPPALSSRARSRELPAASSAACSFTARARSHALNRWRAGASGRSAFVHKTAPGAPHRPTSRPSAASSACASVASGV
eukprot:12795714-Heterocapsa_arctica.AAC.1